MAGKQHRFASISMPPLSGVRETDRFATKSNVGDDSIMVACFNQMVAMQQFREVVNSRSSITLQNKFNMDSRWVLGDRLNPKAKHKNCY